MNEQTSDHFKGKSASDHLLEKKLQVASELHGDELEDHVSVFLSALRDTAVVLMFCWTILFSLRASFSQYLIFVVPFAFGWLVWRVARTAWLSWAKLERIHRLVEEERYEIEHHRDQERDELKALYAIKGFEGELLEEVVDVLMADDDRLLNVMVEEELGLNLESNVHPLKQALYAFFGVFLSIIVSFMGFLLAPSFGILVSTFIIISFAAGCSAYLQKNEVFPSIVWGVSIAALSFGTVYFIINWILYLLIS